VVVIVGGNRIVSLRALLVVQRENGLTPICSCGEMSALRMTRTPKNILVENFGYNLFYLCVNNKLVLIFGLLIYRVVVPIM